MVILDVCYIHVCTCMYMYMYVHVHICTCRYMYVNVHKPLVHVDIHNVCFILEIQ